jgi:hypothetical protein
MFPRFGPAYMRANDSAGGALVKPAWIAEIVGGLSLAMPCDLAMMARRRMSRAGI